MFGPDNSFMYCSALISHWPDRDNDDQEDQRAGGKDQRKSNLVGSTLTDGTFDEADHAIEERLAGPAVIAHDDAIRDDSGTTGDAGRSPPVSRITGADSPVIGDSSIDATPSMISPSPGITCPA